MIKNLNPPRITRMPESPGAAAAVWLPDAFAITYKPHTKGTTPQKGYETSRSLEADVKTLLQNGQYTACGFG
jgi:hypothetical protein